MNPLGAMHTPPLAIRFLGTNGWYDSETGNTVCTLISAPEAVVVLDAGYGLAKLDRYLPANDERPVFLLLSHFHLDHVVGLHTLGKFKLHGGLTLGCPTGGRAVLRTLVNRPFTIPLDDLPYPARSCELPGEASRLPFPVQVLPLRHVGLTLGYRLNLGGRVIAYLPDTGYCANAVTLARSADLLIAECAFKPGQSSESWPHLNPETAGQIAREAGARRLALTHFDARTYPSLPERSEAEAAARKEFPAALAAYDDLGIEC